MGCSASRLEHGEASTGRPGGGDVSAVAVAIGIWPIRRGIDEIRRRRGGIKVRKDSIVSTTELLIPEERDASDADTPREESIAGKGNSQERENADSVRSGNQEGDNREHHEDLAGYGNSHDEDAKPIRSGNHDGDTSEKQEDLEGDDQGEKQAESLGLMEKTDDEHEKEKEASTAAEVDEEEGEEDEEPSPAGLSRWADLPGSPSFRIYYVANDSDDESVKVSWMHKRNKSKGQVLQEKDIIKEEEPTKEKSNEKEELSEQPEPEQKQEKVAEKEIKNDKGRRLRSLWKAPSRVYSFLNVRNCYHQNAATTAADGAGTSSSARGIARICPSPPQTAAAANLAAEKAE